MEDHEAFKGHESGNERPKLMDGYIALKHPTAMLGMKSTPDGKFVAKFYEYPDADNPVKFLNLLASTLSHKPRFAGQNRQPDFSVLTHQLFVGEYLRKKVYSDEIQLLGYMHDAGEAFFVDIPTPFKMPVDSDREMAIVEAMPYAFLSKFLRYKDKAHPVHVADWYSCIAEALEFGYDWRWPREWMEKASEEQRHEVKTMQIIIRTMDLGVEFLWDYGYAAEPWLTRVTALLEELGYDKCVRDTPAAAG